jgi:sugar/nucleoside kinase (ribokinase family)
MKIIALAEVVVDWLSLKPGETILTAAEFHRALGGNSTNVAIGLQRLGVPVHLLGKIGDDFHADFLQSALQAENIDPTHIIRDARYPTAQCYMTTTTDEEHRFRNWPRPHAADMLMDEDLPMDLLRSVDLLHSTGISMVSDPRRSAVAKAIDIASESGAIISFDAGFPTTARTEAHESIESVLGKTHLLKMNESELFFWAGEDPSGSLDETARRVFERYRPVALLVTLAAAGSKVFTAQHTVSCQPFPVQALSGVGAGDAYIAGFIYWISQLLKDKQRPWRERLNGLAEQDWRQAGWAGNIAGAMATLELNAYSGMPNGAKLADGLRFYTPRTEIS